MSDKRALGPNHWHGVVRSMHVGMARFVDEFLQGLRQPAMSLPRFMCGNLHGDRKKLIVIAFDMAAHQGDEMLGGGHFISLLASRDFLAHTRL